MLQQEIVQNSDTLEAPGFFGTEVRIVKFTAVGIKEDLKKWRIPAVPIKPHAVVKIHEVKPSRPGALFGFNLFKTTKSLLHWVAETWIF